MTFTSHSSSSRAASAVPHIPEAIMKLFAPPFRQVGWGYVFAPGVGAVIALSSGAVHRFFPFVAHAITAVATIVCAVCLSHPVRE